jgi:predicted dehydrogenase
MRFGLIGTGYWARTLHGPGVRAHPDATLAGVWGRDPAKAGVVAAELGSHHYPELDTMLRDVDAVSIAVPPSIQPELAVRAAGHGCHLLLDKPLALDVAAAERVIEAVDSAGVRAAVFFTIRYTANIATWLSGLAPDGWLAARVRMFTSIYEPGNPYAGSAWRREKGALWDIGPHALSVVLPVLGAAESVVAQPGPGDQADLIVQHTSGATSTISLSLTAPAGAQGSDWQLFGSTGTAVMPKPGGTPLDAFAHCLSAVTRPSPGGGPCADLALGRDITAVLAAAEGFLGRSPGSAAPVAG